MSKRQPGLNVAYNEGGESLLKEAALIVRVWDDCKVDLVVFNRKGNRRREKGVWLTEPGYDGPSPSERYATFLGA